MSFEIHGLTEDAFARKLDCRFMYYSASFVAAQRALTDAVEVAAGPVLLTGETGVGKTTLLEHVVAGLRNNGWAPTLLTGSALKRQHNANADELSRSLGEWRSSRHTAAPGAGNNVRAETASRGQGALLIIDDADDLPDAVVESLSGQQSSTGPARADPVILVGPPTFAERMKAGATADIGMREISLRPLSNDDVAGYVQHRLQVAGTEPHEIFSPIALDLIASYSQGNPGRINRLCASAMILSEVEQRISIDAGLLHEAAVDALLITADEQWRAGAGVAAGQSPGRMLAVIPSAAKSDANRRWSGLRRISAALGQLAASVKSLLLTSRRYLFGRNGSIAGRLGIAGLAATVTASTIWLHGVGHAPVCIVDEPQADAGATTSIVRNNDIAALWLPVRNDPVAARGLPQQSLSGAAAVAFASTEALPATGSLPPSQSANVVAEKYQSQDVVPVEQVVEESGDSAVLPNDVEEPGGEPVKFQPPKVTTAAESEPPARITAVERFAERPAPRPVQRYEDKRKIATVSKRPPNAVARYQHAKRIEETMVATDRLTSTTSAGWQVIRN